MFETVLLEASNFPINPQFIMLGGMAIIFYFFMLRPQQRKQKEQKQFTQDVKKGDDVVTLGGIHGKIHALDDNTITLEIDRGCKMVIERSSLSMEASKRLQEKA